MSLVRAAGGGREPILVTGVGFVTPLGGTAAGLDAALATGRCALAARPLEIEGLGASLVPVAACADFDDEAAPRGPSGVLPDRGTAMALHAARQAFADAGLAPGAADPHRVGVYWGCGMGGAASFDQATQALYGEGRRLRPTTVLTTMPNAAVAELSMAFQARGASISYACACASSAVAVGEAMRAIRGGWIDLALVGGHEALLTPGVMAGWQAMRVLAPVSGGGAQGACRPFAADRAGFALGEGAAALVIESAAHARRRRAPARVALAGYGTSCDAQHISQPASEGQVRAMRLALADAGLAAADIGHVNSHGTATAAGDAAEAASLCEVFGAHGVPVSATKSLHGHLMGAGGAVELVCALRALERQCLPPAAGVAEPDPAFGIDLVCGSTARRVPGLRHVLSNSFAFGGTNAVLVASRLD